MGEESGTTLLALSRQRHERYKIHIETPSALLKLLLDDIEGQDWLEKSRVETSEGPVTSSAGFSVPCLSRLRLRLCPTASVRQGVVAEVLPLDPHKHSHIPAAQGGNVWSLQAEMGHFSTATADEAFTAVNYSACVFKDSVNNYSGVGFFKHTNGIFIKRPFLQK